LPKAAKIALGAAVLYLVSPIDLIPDFIPGLGFIDDVFVAAILVDGMLNFVNRGLVLKYWPGSAESLERIARSAQVLAAWVPRRLKLRIFSSPSYRRREARAARLIRRCGGSPPASGDSRRIPARIRAGTPARRTSPGIAP
jgi:uncharacterized membrane protein YkvA (DUF1232 family)